MCLIVIIWTLHISHQRNSGWL